MYTADLVSLIQQYRLSPHLVAALVLSRLDYCNSLLFDLPAILIQRLQSVQNAAARLIYNLRRCDHISDALISLHWLRVPQRITFKGGGADVPRITWHGTTLHNVVIYRCCRHATPTHAQVRIY